MSRCRVIGAFFEASDVDVACFQEVFTYGHLALLAPRMRSFRYVSFRRALPGPAGGVVTFSRLPVASTAFHGFGRDFVSETGLADAFEGRCPPTFRAEYLPARATPHCIDFILTTGAVNASAANVLFAGKQEMRGGPGYVSDHLGLSARLQLVEHLHV